MKKRYRTPTAKAGELLVKYGKEFGDEDLFYCYGGEGATHGDSNLVMSAFNNEKLYNGNGLIKELELRGYDIKTLTFSIKKKAV